MSVAFPFDHHPCWSNSRNELWERIHLPVAAKCNLRCAYCDNAQASCHSIGPGSCETIFSVEEAWRSLLFEIAHRPELRIVGISGPGEPLYNGETFDLLRRISTSELNMRICLSTNGVLLKERMSELVNIGVDSISISFSAIRPATAAKIYQLMIIEDEIFKDTRLGKKIITRQLDGIREARSYGIPVKVNTILIPGVNTTEMKLISKKVAEAGATLQNIMPIVPRGKMKQYQPPEIAELDRVRCIASEYITQFTHCRQCRSDVVGIPGEDSIISIR